jgi:hypothetical protein
MPNKPVPIPFPRSSLPGANPQEGSGRLINCYVEPLGENGQGAIAPQVWRRSPGLSVLARIGTVGGVTYSGYRGGLIAGGLSYEAWNNEAATLDSFGDFTPLGVFPGNKPVSMAHNQIQPSPDVVAVDPDFGAYILHTTNLANASATATIGGTRLNSGDSVTITFSNSTVANAYVSVTYSLGAGATTTSIATGLTTAINNDATLARNSVTATSSGAVITITQPGSVANQTMMTWARAGAGNGNETVTFVPASGLLAGGEGTAGISFSGTPLLYTGVGAMPQPNSVCFQDGYFFFSVANGQVFATELNSLAMNSLTYVTIQSHSDVTLSRVIAFSGYLLCFTTASLEIWGDAGNAPPAFPYNRAVVLETGLIQPSAIAGFETGFSELLWVDQDSGVHYMPPSSLSPPTKVSPPDLDKLIEAQVNAGATLEASCYYFAGQKFWTLSSPAWTWEYNIRTQEWNERWSLQPTGIYSRWRARLGHPAFNKFICGDMLSGNILYIDDQNYTEVGVPQLFRIESGPVAAFPMQVRVARADFLFDFGVGTVSRHFTMAIATATMGAVTGAHNAIRLTVNDTSQASNNDTVLVTGVSSVTGIAANGTWQMNLIDSTHIDLIGSLYNGNFSFVATTNGTSSLAVTSTTGVLAVNQPIAGQDIAPGTVIASIGTAGGGPGTYTLSAAATGSHTGVSLTASAYASGGTAVDLSVTPQQLEPVCAVSWSVDGGLSFGNPLIRSLGPQDLSKRVRVSVKNCGLSSSLGNRWRIDVTDAVYTGLMMGTQSGDPRAVGP